MPGIVPIASARISDSLVRSRLLTQLQFDQQQLFRVQTQVSTGRRIMLPSEDAPAALRAIGLQRLIERKDQVKVNLATNQSFLAATDATLNNVSSLLADIRGSALGVTNSTSSDAQRQAVATEVARAIEQLVNTGNQSFRGRFLFAGTQTTIAPFAFSGPYVTYQGNEGQLESYADIDLLFESSMNGNEVFGAISETVQGSTDLNPALTSDTLLADLHGGRGISRGSIAISDGVSRTIIDLSGAATIGDVARLIEASPLGSRTVTATVTATGLEIQLDSGGGGNLTIKEVGGGTTARELGILETAGAGTGPLAGKDLDPRLLRTTSLDHLSFDRTSGIQIQNAGKTYSISFSTAETVEDVLNLINGSGAAVVAEINAAGTGINVRSKLSGANFSVGENGGTSAGDLGISTFMPDTRLADLNRGQGVRVIDGPDFAIQRNDGSVLEIDLSGALTIGDAIDRINSHPDNQDAAAVLARQAEFGNGIELVDDHPSELDGQGQPYVLTVSKIGVSHAAADLGLVAVGEPSRTASPGTPAVLTGLDVNPQETRGVFNSLVRLKQALEANDLVGIQNALALLDDDAERVNASRADLGARQQSLDVLAARLDAEQIELESALSLEIDVDLTEAISEMTARQIAYEASLRTTAGLLQQSLMDYL